MRVSGLVAIASIVVAAAAAGGVSAQEEPLFGPMAPARLEGGWVLTNISDEGQVEQLGELMFESSGGFATFHVTSDDPRFKGTATVNGDWIGHYPPALVAVADSNWRMEDDWGAWMGSSRHLASMGDDSPLNADEQVILDGSGAYEGLTAYVIIDHAAEAFVGAIIPDVMPELPADWLEILQASSNDDPDSDG